MQDLGRRPGAGAEQAVELPRGLVQVEDEREGDVVHRYLRSGGAGQLTGDDRGCSGRVTPKPMSFTVTVPAQLAARRGEPLLGHAGRASRSGVPVIWSASDSSAGRAASSAARSAGSRCFRSRAHLRPADPEDPIAIRPRRCA